MPSQLWPFYSKQKLLIDFKGSHPMSVVDLTTSDAEEDALAPRYTGAPQSLFPDGAFKLTFNHFACPERADYLSFDEIIGDVQHGGSARLSSF